MSEPRLHVVETGTGIPVVLLHGLTATSHYVVMGSKALERSGHRVLGYDARGHGRSEPGDRYDYEQLAADLERVLDENGIDRAVLAGASMGAHTALHLALERPRRVAGMVLATPAHDPAAFPQGLPGWDALAAGLRAGGVEGFVAAYDLHSVGVRWRDSVGTVLRQRMNRHAHPLAVADALEQVPRSAPFAAFDDLAAIACPVTVVGDRDDADPQHPLRIAQAYADAIPGATLVVEDEGASPIAWQGAQLSRVIAELAARVAQQLG
jgi:pimeloyl-ACP methyl ester carboxylesterase